MHFARLQLQILFSVNANAEPVLGVATDHGKTALIVISLFCRQG
jgi:hypothetical protein